MESSVKKSKHLVFKLDSLQFTNDMGSTLFFAMLDFILTQMNQLPCVYPVFRFLTCTMDAKEDKNWKQILAIDQAKSTINQIKQIHTRVQEELKYENDSITLMIGIGSTFLTLKEAVFIKLPALNLTTEEEMPKKLLMSFMQQISVSSYLEDSPETFQIRPTNTFVMIHSSRKIFDCEQVSEIRLLSRCRKTFIQINLQGEVLRNEFSFESLNRDNMYWNIFSTHIKGFKNSLFK